MMPVFQSIDETASRSDLAARSETKFVLNDVDLSMLRRLLEKNGRRLIHNRKVSTVRSIYFDDSNLSSAHANLDGLGIRRKLRLRWYDQLVPGNHAYLEIKWRNNRITGKHRLRVHCDQPLGEISYRLLKRGLQACITDTYRIPLSIYSDPILLVEYSREHFVSTDGKLRITIDYGLSFYDQTGKFSISTKFPKNLPGRVVIEGKAPVGCEQELRTMLHPLQLRANRCSKYISGLKTVGLLSHAL